MTPSRNDLDNNLNINARMILVTMITIKTEITKTTSAHHKHQQYDDDDDDIKCHEMLMLMLDL